MSSPESSNLNKTNSGGHRSVVSWLHKNSYCRRLAMWYDKRMSDKEEHYGALAIFFSPALAKKKPSHLDTWCWLIYSQSNCLFWFYFSFSKLCKLIIIDFFGCWYNNCWFSLIGCLHIWIVIVVAWIGGGRSSRNGKTGISLSTDQSVCL